MKYAFLGVIFLVASCGKYEAPGSNSTVGQIRSLASTRALGPDEQNALATVCQALGVKASRLPSGLNAPFSFTTLQTDCEGSTVSSGIVATTIKGETPNFYFTSQGTNFIFPNVETPTSGVFTQVCNTLGNVQDVSTLTSGEAQWVSTSQATGTDCPGVSGETCVLFETGAVQSGSDFKIHTREWIRIRTNPSLTNYGFFTYRKKITQAFCPENKAINYQATLN